MKCAEDAKITQLKYRVVLFLHQRFWFRCRLVVWAADPKRIHPVLEHASADPELIGSVGLHIIVFLQGIEDDFPLEFHDRFLERQSSSQGVFAE